MITRRGFASKVLLERLCRRMCGEALPRRPCESMKGFAPGSGFCPNIHRPKAVPGAEPHFLHSVPGEAKPRRTSGGTAGKKALLGQSYAPLDARFSIFAHVSRSPMVRLNTNWSAESRSRQ